MANLEALLFDVDGTLADTERDGHRVAFNAAFAGQGLDWDWSVAMYGKLLRVTGGKERIRHYLTHFNTEFEPPEDLDGFIVGLHQAKTAHYTRMLAEGRIPMRPGVHRLLDEARAEGMRLAIATTTTPENVGALLRYGLGPDAESWFEVIAAGDIVPAKKPAPDIYTFAMHELGLPQAACLAFEDSDNGLRSALGAGIESVVVTVNDYTREQDFDGAILVLDQLGDPDAPCRVLKGRLDGAAMVTMDLLRNLHASTPLVA